MSDMHSQDKHVAVNGDQKAAGDGTPRITAKQLGCTHFPEHPTLLRNVIVPVLRDTARDLAAWISAKLPSLKGNRD